MISADDIVAESQALANRSRPDATVPVVLGMLIKQIEPIDFRAYVFDSFDELIQRKEELDSLSRNPDGSVNESLQEKHQEEISQIQERLESMKVKQKHYLIIFIEQLLEIAKNNGWSLCKRHSYYYVYNGEYWLVIEEADLKIFLGKAAEKMGVPKFDSRHFEFKDKLFKQFESTAHLPEPEIENDTILVNLKNGTLEITPSGHRLRSFNPDDFLTYQLPFEYDPKATAPKFHKYLNEVLPDEESRRVLPEYMGYIFTRNLKLEKVLFLYGSGRNGKSVLFDIIKAMLGEESISFYGLSSITDEKGYHRAKLTNKLINWASDVGDKLQSNTFKQLASGEPIECRLPHKEPFLLRNICKFAFNTNTLPADVEHTDAFFERFLIIPFEQYIKPEDRDPKLAEKIITRELPGVLNWVLSGLDRLVSQQKFSPCKASDEALSAFRKESDSVALFTSEMNYKPAADQWTKAKPVYTDYRSYCLDEGMKPLARKNFHKRLESLGYFLSVKNVGKVIHMRKHQTNGEASPF